MLTLRKFVALVDQELNQKCGLSVHDLPDYDFDNYFEDDFSDEETKGAVEDCVSDIMYDLKLLPSQQEA